MQGDILKGFVWDEMILSTDQQCLGDQKVTGNVKQKKKIGNKALMCLKSNFAVESE